ncbi:MAG TPA: AbrB/MazE/SpoVT family DNA-binding domain-containing protein [Pyrinomonadaceae bacterium]|jgi:antitoxin MazE|nr:AbrB/MazE/SpoVT family DNA-binding domain-containing protein [Pyrinomonadaceae bacterium]
MRVQIQKWGNSLALRIPKSLGEQIGIKLGSEVDISVQKGSIMITPIRNTANKESLIAFIARTDLSDSAIREISKEVKTIFTRYADREKKAKMMVFKTSGETFNEVISNEKHAFAVLPKNCVKGTVVLVSKNKTACLPSEKQISYFGKVKNVRLLEQGEAGDIWGSKNENRWKYIVEFEKIKPIKHPFNLEDVLFEKARFYGPAVAFATIDSNHAKLISLYLK